MPPKKRTTTRARVAKSAALDAMIERVDAALAIAKGEEAAPTPTARPFAMAGVPGTAVYGGVVATRETNPTLIGSQRWKTFAELKQNNDAGVGTAIRFLLALIGKVDWRWPANPKAKNAGQAEDVAGWVQEAVTAGATPWRRVVRSLSSYLWDGATLAEWSAERKRAGNVGIADIQARGMHTIDRWIRDPRTRAITGVLQRDPENGRVIPISRKKLIYIVDDALSDSPIGTGLLRQAIRGVHRERRYLQLEGSGFETNLRGVPVVWAPLSALRRELEAKTITPEAAAAVLDPLEDIIQHHVRSTETGYMLDSETHRNPDGSPTAVKAYGIELLKGDATGEEPLGKAIDRERYAIATLFGTQVLYAGAGGKGSLALSKQQADLAVMLVEGILADVAESVYSDLVKPIGALNQWDEDLLPRPVPAGLLVRDPEVLAKMLVDCAAADPDGTDPAIDEIRASQGLSIRPPRDPGEEGAMRVTPDPDADEPDEPDPGGDAPDEDPEIDEED